MSEYKFNEAQNAKLCLLSFVEDAGKDKHGAPQAIYRCACGSEKPRSKYAVEHGRIRSCGCTRVAPNRIHGESKTALYHCWQHMMHRCFNRKNKHYKDYGARGISVCAKWRDDFLAFKQDMGNRPSAAHSLERIDNNKGYSPGNCKWATAKEQIANRRPIKLSDEDVRMIDFALRQGRSRKSLTEQFNVGRQTIADIATGKRKHVGVQTFTGEPK